MPDLPRAVYLPRHIIRQMFNESEYPELIRLGALLTFFLRNSHLQAPEEWQGPFCTHGQTIRYLDSRGQWVVEVFQYLRPDSTLGASGKPDPKRLRLGDTIYIAEHD